MNGADYTNRNSSTAYGTKHMNKLGCGLCSLAPAEGLELLFTGLEPSMSKLGCSVDEFELDLLKSRPLGAGKQSMSQSDDTLLGSRNGTLHTMSCEHRHAMTDHM